MTTSAEIQIASPMNMAANRAALISLIEHFHSDRLEYVALGDLSRFPDIAGDLDIVVRDFNRCVRVLAAFCTQHGARIIRAHLHATGIRFDLTVPGDDGRPTLINGPDLIFFPTWKIFGRLGIDLPSIISNRQLAPKENLYTPMDADAFLFYLVRRIDKGALEKTQTEYLARLWNRSSVPIRQGLMKVLPKSMCSEVLEAIEANRWDVLETNACSYYQQLRRAARVDVKRVLWTVWRTFYKVINPSGCFIAFFGPDGSGKSSVIGAIQEQFADAFSRTHYTHLRPRIGQSNHSGLAVTEPHAKPPRGRLVSLLKLGYLAFDYIFGYATVVRPMLVRSTLVIFDRYYHDMLVDPKRYRLGISARALKLIEKFIPRPDLIILLDAPAEVLQTRKREVSAEESARQREKYRAVLSELPECVIVDANQPLERVVADTNEAILNFLDRRARKDLHTLRAP